MSELDRDAAALIRSGRTAFRPDASDRDRVLASLNAVLGGGARPDGSRPSGRADAATASHVALKTWLAGSLAAVAMSAGIIVTWHPWSRAPSRQPSPSTPAAVVVETTASIRPSEPAVPSSSDVRSTLERPRPASSRSGAHPPADFLPEEVRLLSRAEQQMNDGLAEDALRTLAEHERKFPTGSLAEERMAARVQVLCALGRTAEAKSDLTRLTRAYPKSPHLERARSVCGSDVARAPSP